MKSKAIIVSDLHLGTKDSKAKDFVEFLDKRIVLLNLVLVVQLTHPSFVVSPVLIGTIDTSVFYHHGDCEDCNDENSPKD